jgi:uncharacterized protein YdeI (YjbR/CyaY-like superfamily)
MKDKVVDDYIENSPAFAQPILHHFRNLVFSACPSVEETIKWGFPNFEYKGKFCAMASFKAHCAITFYKADLLTDPHKILSKVGETSMGQLGKIKSIEDLPSDDILLAYLKEAVKINESGIKTAKKTAPTLEIEMPLDFENALATNEKASEHFKNFSPGKRKDYIKWILEAKTEATREKRIATALEWISEGKSKDWKYLKK